MTEHTATQNTSLDNLIQLLLNEGYENGLPRIAEMILNAAMLIERRTHLSAQPYERCEKRNGYANGFKDRVFKSTLGEMNLLRNGATVRCRKPPTSSSTPPILVGPEKPYEGRGARKKGLSCAPFWIAETSAKRTCLIQRLRFEAAAASSRLIASPTWPLRKLRPNRKSLFRCPIRGSIAARLRNCSAPRKLSQEL
jgi:hypothetical protein